MTNNNNNKNITNDLNIPLHDLPYKPSPQLLQPPCPDDSRNTFTTIPLYSITNSSTLSFAYQITILYMLYF